MPETIVTTIRLEPELKRELETIARREKRSLSNLIALILSEYIERQKKGHS